MKIEIRADGLLHISGYANVTERRSRPVITPRGKVEEVIHSGAFRDALSRAKNVALTRDHDHDPVLAETRTGSLELYEDAIGLHYDATIADEETVQDARARKIRGVSFGMFNVRDELETRADALPIRHVRALDLDHITLVVHKCPVYSATSVEVRASGEEELETRSGDGGEPVTVDNSPRYDNSAFKARLEKLRK